MDQNQRNRRTVTRLCVVVVAMFGFGYALVPLYDVFCDITGLNGKTGQLDVSPVPSGAVDRQRAVTVEFVTSTAPGLPWDFRANQRKATVHPGEVTEVLFTASNYSSNTTVGQAVPSVAPGTASRYFNKTECFCFTQQALAPGETRTLPVRFVVDADLPEKVSVLTLSYTFFALPQEHESSPRITISGKES